MTNPSPKQRFQESADNISKHKRLVDQTEFQRGADFAMLEYQKMVALQTTDPNSSMAAGLKMTGALEFLQIFKLLAETPAPPQAPLTRNLDHNA